MHLVTTVSNSKLVVEFLLCIRKVKDKQGHLSPPHIPLTTWAGATHQALEVVIRWHGSYHPPPESAAAAAFSGVWGEWLSKACSSAPCWKGRMRGCS